MPPNKLWCKGGTGDKTEEDKKEKKFAQIYICDNEITYDGGDGRKYRFMMMGKVKAQTTAANCSPFARLPTATPLPLPHRLWKKKGRGGGRNRKKKRKKKMNVQTVNLVLLP